MIFRTRQTVLWLRCGVGNWHATLEPWSFSVLQAIAFIQAKIRVVFAGPRRQFRALAWSQRLVDTRFPLRISFLTPVSLDLAGQPLDSDQEGASSEPFERSCRELCLHCIRWVILDEMEPWTAMGPWRQRLGTGCGTSVTENLKAYMGYWTVYSLPGDAVSSFRLT